MLRSSVEVPKRSDRRPLSKTLGGCKSVMAIFIRGLIHDTSMRPKNAFSSLWRLTKTRILSPGQLVSRLFRIRQVYPPSQSATCPVRRQESATLLQASALANDWWRKQNTQTILSNACFGSNLWKHCQRVVQVMQFIDFDAPRDHDSWEPASSFPQ